MRQPYCLSTDIVMWRTSISIVCPWIVCKCCKVALASWSRGKARRKSSHRCRTAAKVCVRYLNHTSSSCSNLRDIRVISDYLRTGGNQPSTETLRNMVRVLWACRHLRSVQPSVIHRWHHRIDSNHLHAEGVFAPVATSWSQVCDQWQDAFR